MGGMVEQFMDGMNVSSELTGVIQEHLHDTLKDLGEQYNVTIHKEVLNSGKDEEKDAKDKEEKKDEKDGKDEEKKDEKDAKEEEEKKEEKEEKEEEKEDKKKEEEKEEEKEEKEETKDSRLFDGSIPSIVRGDGSAVFACFFSGALVAAFGLVAMRRRRPSSVALRTEDSHEMLIAEDSEAAEA